MYGTGLRIFPSEDGPPGNASSSNDDGAFRIDNFQIMSMRYYVFERLNQIGERNRRGKREGREGGRDIGT